MRVNFCLLVFIVYHVGVIGDTETEEDNNRKKLLEQLTKTRSVLLDEYHLVTRLIANNVKMYRSYRTVSVINYPIAVDVADAQFTFTAEELHLNSIGKCNENHVIVNLKHGSYPTINPDGYDFPKNFIPSTHREGIHTIELWSDGQNRTYTLKNPKPGKWYALVYIQWEDPKTQKVEQQGLVAVCDTILYTDLQVRVDTDITFIDCYTGLTIQYEDIPKKFKCITLDSVEPVTLNITILNTPIVSNITVRIQAATFPSTDNNLVTCALNLEVDKLHSVTFIPNPNMWHYIELSHTENASSIPDCDLNYVRSNFETDNHSIVELMRDDKGRFFTFDYAIPTTDLHDLTSLVNLTSNEIKSLRFKVNDLLDIGGSLIIEASLLMSLKYYMGYKREAEKDKLLAFTEDNQFMRAVICMDIDHASEPLPTGHCRYNDRVKPAMFVLNSTDSESIHNKIIIPYPESGVWYLTFRLFGDEVVCPCRTSDNGMKYYVDPNALEKDRMMLQGDEVREGVSESNATVVLSISSGSCVNGQCSNKGNCLLNTFGGLVMSFCSCPSGYGAWDCSDDTRMDSRGYMLTSVLLLTLSNILFFFSIYVATIRYYYTEAMMYTCTLFFSTFYHACDASVEVAYCIFRGNILQFGDFYSGILSFWVTLMAMSILTDKLRSFLQLTGAIVVALLTTWNMHSIVVFILPVAVGVVILLISWIINYKRYSKLCYSRSYYTRYLPLGMVLVSIGLICFAFLQTEQNYKFIHSVWHMIIAVSVVVLLPDVRKNNTNPFLPSPTILDFFKRPQRVSSEFNTAIRN